ncbi:chemotaxis protein CheX [Fluviispira vulneris]|uniref:chemotaxis protein CheX n=1 Tax=Fluviispira vulneris TaxID=2763012 RepID=UPI00164506FE|nr:chemotaxis protein CheX [Fluviispira vulneris]
MSSQNPLEKKLDRYYEDIMSKIMEILQTQKDLLGEEKDLKKDVAKLKEHVLEIKTNIQAIEAKLSSKSSGISGGSPQPHPPLGASTVSAATLSSVASSNQAQQSGAHLPASSKSLKDFLAQEFAIFDVKVLNAFIKSTKEVIKTNTKNDPTFLKPVIEAGMALPIVIAGKMPLSRDKGKGAMAFSMALEAAQAITKAVFMMPEDGKVTDADIKDVTSEICNQICGKSKLTLKNEGYSFEIGLPEIHQGNPTELLAKLGHPKVALHFEYLKKPFFVFFWG